MSQAQKTRGTVRKWIKVEPGVKANLSFMYNFSSCDDTRYAKPAEEITVQFDLVELAYDKINENEDQDQNPVHPTFTAAKWRAYEYQSFERRGMFGGTCTIRACRDAYCPKIVQVTSTTWNSSTQAKVAFQAWNKILKINGSIKPVTLMVTMPSQNACVLM